MNPKLLDKIIEAVPDIQARNTSVRIPEPFGGIINYRDDTIRLNDVLLAMEIDKMKWEATDMDKLFEICKAWNLKNNDLTQQSKELIDLLERILL